MKNLPGVVVRKAPGKKCARCWKVLEEVGLQSRNDVCKRCDKALDELCEKTMWNVEWIREKEKKGKLKEALETPWEIITYADFGR